jgi:uncharacterized protein YbaP (TraB family)
LTPIRFLGYLFACALAAVFYCVPAYAQNACPPPLTAPPARQLQDAEKSAVDRGYLWRLTKDGHSSYLYGTVHLAKLEWIFPGPQLLQAFRTSGVLAVELNLFDAEVIHQLQRGIAADPGQKISVGLQRRLSSAAGQQCIDSNALKAQRLEIQISTLGMAQARRWGLEPVYGIEQVLLARANRVAMPIESLETVAEQLKALLGESMEDSVALTEQGLDELENDDGEKLLMKLTDAWSQSDFTTLDSYLQWCDCIHTDSARRALKRLLDDRNPVIASRLDRLHHSGKQVFAAVGSLHMIGSIGLPAEMQRLGYRVEKVF